MLKRLVEAEAIEIGHHRNARKATFGKVPTPLTLQHLLQPVSGGE
jgi:hypothetical protein